MIVTSFFICYLVGLKCNNIPYAIQLHKIVKYTDQSDNNW